MVSLAILATAILGGIKQSTAATTAPSDDGQRLYPDSNIKTTGRFSVEITGHGPDLILIPGLCSSREVWHHAADHLRDHYTLHILQVAGFAGETPRDNASGPVLDPTVEAIDAYITDNKLAPVTVIGHSMGGTMALRLAQQHPADVKKICVVDSLPFYGVLIGGKDATTDSIKPVAAAVQKQLEAPPTDASKAAGRKMLDMRPGLSKMKTPVTLIYPFDAQLGIAPAKWDPLYQSQFEAIPEKTLIKIEDATNFVMLDQPEKFDAAEDGFLKE